MPNADCRLLILVPLIRAAHLHIAESCGRSAMAGAHHLLGLALAAIGRTPQGPSIARADGVHGVPEIGGDAGVRRILEHAAESAVFDLPSDLAAKLKVVALVVDGPGAVGVHEDAVVGGGDELS